MDGGRASPGPEIPLLAPHRVGGRVFNMQPTLPCSQEWGVTWLLEGSVSGWLHALVSAWSTAKLLCPNKAHYLTEIYLHLRCDFITIECVVHKILKQGTSELRFKISCHGNDACGSLAKSDLSGNSSLTILKLARLTNHETFQFFFNNVDTHNIASFQTQCN